jgi:energy-coupling factor transport system substrate-specific component
MLVAKLALDFIPNIELVSLLFIIYAHAFGKKTFYIVYTFAFIEGLVWGFDPSWWTMYLYIWDIIVIAAIIFKGNESPIFWAIVSGFFGLFFGLLGILPIFVIGLGQGGSIHAGVSLAFSYWLSGIAFDIRHCIGNFTAALILYKPLTYAMNKVTKIIYR